MTIQYETLPFKTPTKFTGTNFWLNRWKQLCCTNNTFQVATTARKTKNLYLKECRGETVIKSGATTKLFQRKLSTEWKLKRPVRDTPCASLVVPVGRKSKPVKPKRLHSLRCKQKVLTFLTIPIQNKFLYGRTNFKVKKRSTIHSAKCGSSFDTSNDLIK